MIPGFLLLHRKRADKIPAELRGYFVLEFSSGKLFNDIHAPNGDDTQHLIVGSTKGFGIRIDDAVVDFVMRIIFAYERQAGLIPPAVAGTN